MRFVVAAWMLHAIWVGEEAGARNLLFFRVKWLQPAMKGTLCVCVCAAVAAAAVPSIVGASSVFCNEWLFMHAWFFALVELLVPDRSVMAA